MELEARKASFVREVLTDVDSLDLLEKLQKAYIRLKKQAAKGEKEEEDTISKEEILAGIDAGLKDWKAGRKKSARDFIKELRDEI